MSGRNKSGRHGVAELGMPNPLFGLLDGHVEWMHDGWIQPEWVQQRLNIIAVPALIVSNEELAPEEFRSRLQQQKLVVHLSNTINVITAKYPSLFTPEDVRDALATIAAWVSNHQPLPKNHHHGNPTTNPT